MGAKSCVMRICGYADHIEMRKKQFEEAKRHGRIKPAAAAGRRKDETLEEFKKRMLEKLHTSGASACK